MLGWFKKKLGGKKGEEGQAPPPPAAEAAVVLPEESSPAPVSTPVAERSPSPAVAAAPVGEEVNGDRKSLFQRLAQRLSKTRQTLISRIDGVFAGRKKIDAELFDDLEEILITADLGVRTAGDLLDAARRRVQRDKLSDPTALKEVLKELLLGYLVKADRASELAMPAEGPLVIMVLGVNGV
ncbi:MAG: signal recognition particle receptor subunit alpha, partial [Thermodesulfobacteriota bacterium]